jgi:hypothetical protein
LISPAGGEVLDEPTHASAHRAFRDDKGIYWEVWEVHPRGREDLIPPGMRRDLQLVSPELSVGWLAFESAGERRRHAPIPLGWAERTRQGLIELLENAKVVRPSNPIWPARAEDLEISPQ